MRNFLFLFIVIFYSERILSQEDLHFSTIITKDSDEIHACVDKVENKEVFFRKNCIEGELQLTISLYKVFAIIDPYGVRTYYKNGALYRIEERRLAVVERGGNDAPSEQEVVPKPQVNYQSPTENTSVLVTNEIIATWVRNGIAEKDIITSIQSRECSFDLSVNGLKYLGNAGVSPEVIRTMMAKQK